MNSNYSTIRYHIYKELYKYLIEQEKNKTSILNQFSIPLFSGLAIALISGIINRNSWYYLIYILIGYWGLLCISLGLVRLFRYIKLRYFPRKETRLLGVTEEEIYAAKFNYEITYLVKTSYSQLLDLSDDNRLRQLQLIEVCFNLKNALRKINESLIRYSKGKISTELILPKKLESVFNMIYYSIEKMKTEMNPNEYELSSLEENYRIVRTGLCDIYGIEFAK